LRGNFRVGMTIGMVKLHKRLLGLINLRPFRAARRAQHRMGSKSLTIALARLQAMVLAS